MKSKKSKKTKKVPLVVNKGTMWLSGTILSLEGLLGGIVLLKLILITSSQMEVNSAILNINMNLTKALNQLYIAGTVPPEKKGGYLVDVERQVRASSDQLVEYLGDEVPGCGYDNFGRPMNSDDAPMRLVSESGGPAGKLLDLETKASYPDGTQCKPKIRKIGFIETLKRDASKSNKFEWTIGILGFALVILKTIEFKRSKSR